MKTKLLCSTILLAFTVNVLNAQWTRTHITSTNSTTIEAMCEHNGELFAAEFGNGLMMLNQTTNQWEQVSSNLPPSTNSAHIVNLASSGDYLYAYLRDQYCVNELIYKSDDNGTTFVPDTVGLPVYVYHSYSGCLGLYLAAGEVYVVGGKIYNIYGGGYYSKYPDDPSWTQETDPDFKFAEPFAEYNDTWYTYADEKFHTSSDMGQTWTATANAGLPAQFSTQLMNVNPVTGRVYIGGVFDWPNKYKILYTDDEGDSWDSLAIDQYLDSNWIGQKQYPINFISNGEDIIINLVNDASQTQPDVIKSTDGGLTFSEDTVGLLIDGFGTAKAVEMLYLNEELYMALNFQDVYKQSAGTSGVLELSKIEVQVFPNPVSNELTINTNSEISIIEVLDVTGRVVETIRPNSHFIKIDCSVYKTGMYFLKMENKSGQIFRSTLIKQ